MLSLKALICGGGCAGPAPALLLARTGHKVTVVERFPFGVDEQGVSFVHNEGRVRGTILANKSGKGAQSLTSEFEIMRGDLVRILFHATRDQVKYVFGTTVESFEQKDDDVTAHFSDGQSETFDILVGADGQGSRIRRAILPPDDPDPYRRLGIHIAYWSIPRISTDDKIMRVYHCPGGRLIMHRSHNKTETQVYFFLRDDQNTLSGIHKASEE